MKEIKEGENYLFCEGDLEEEFHKTIEGIYRRHELFEPSMFELREELTPIITK